MIRKDPKHDKVNPPGQVVYPVRTLAEEADLWKADQYTESVLAIGRKKGYEEGYRDGVKAGKWFTNISRPTDADNSESGR